MTFTAPSFDCKNLTKNHNPTSLSPIGGMMFRPVLLPLLLLASSLSVSATPLQKAIEARDVEAVQALLQQGADVNELGDYGETALTAAILSGSDAIVPLLLDSGAGIANRNSGGFTPLHAAAYTNNESVAALLVERGASIDDQQNKAGVTALSIAAEENHLGVARVLTDHGAGVDLADMNGYTPLTRAIWIGHTDVAQLLIAAGAKCQPVEILEEPAYSNCLKLQ
ncbi:MAG: ankyrin repeat domain-containing protein [Rhodobacteraceae bacterium]|nr:ankyrin repeat domain-containing protein [Paracoccaceae bacterium]